MEQTKTIQLYKILLFVLGVLFVFSLLPKCSSSVIPNNQAIHDTIKVLQIKADTLEVVRTKLVTKWRTSTDTINIHDTIQVKAALQLCDTIIVTDSLEIATLRLINNKFYQVVKSDSLVIDSLKRSKKKYFKGFKHGFASGVIISGVAGSLLILSK